jgi:hypothetical protein
LTNEEIQKMIIDLENEEKDWMNKNKELKNENQVLR